MASENIGSLYPTKIPGYEDAADIQAALKLYHYGSTTYDITNTEPENLLTDSIAGHIQAVVDRVEVIESKGLGSDFLSALPTGVDDGFIWMDSTSNASSSASYASAIYSPVAPTTDLVDGLIWVDKDANPPRGYIYDAGLVDWVAITELPGIVDAAGDLIIGAGPDDITKLPVGSDGQILSVVSGLPSWVSNKTWVLKSSGSLSGSSISATGLNGDKLFVVLKDWSHDNITAESMLTINFNNDMGPNYVNTGGLLSASSLHSPVFSDSVTHDITISVDLSNTSASLKPVSTIADNTAGQYFGYYKNTSPITSVQVSVSPSASFDAGSYQVWSYE